MIPKRPNFNGFFLVASPIMMIFVEGRLQLLGHMVLISVKSTRDDLKPKVIPTKACITRRL